MFESNMTCLFSLKNSEKSIQVYIEIICQKKKKTKTTSSSVLLSGLKYYAESLSYYHRWTQHLNIPFMAVKAQ